jgi:hypothetical protein
MFEAWCRERTELARASFPSHNQVAPHFVPFHLLLKKLDNLVIYIV